ncbi:hypothetical protein [Catenulispora acidiphila]|uniref:hypothetical protein n=1 Tax=Catenulispora acidiphila TaxID=304895 RepID=UPI00019E2ADC|nr:hypothetical protein [Catenulispora acidiphila]
MSDRTSELIIDAAGSFGLYEEPAAVCHSASDVVHIIVSFELNRCWRRASWQVASLLYGAAYQAMRGKVGGYTASVQAAGLVGSTAD